VGNPSAYVLGQRYRNALSFEKKRGGMEEDENRHDLAIGHGEFAVPPVLWGSLFQGMTFDYGVVFFQEFVDKIVYFYSFIGGNHCIVYSLLSAH